MKTIYPFLFLILLLTFSCTGNRRTEANENTIDSLGLQSKRITNTISETLTPTAKEDLSEWEEYNNVDDFILSYYNITIPEALNNSEELANLVQLMKDSIRVENLQKANVIARFNVLHSETLRLADMATIPSISDEEVENEVTQILELYSAVNAKINTIYKAQDIQNSLEVDTETPIEIPEDELSDIEKKLKGNTKQ